MGNRKVERAERGEEATCGCALGGSACGRSEGERGAVQSGQARRARASGGGKGVCVCARARSECVCAVCVGARARVEGAGSGKSNQTSDR